MKKCQSCNILLNTNRKTCPLCYDALVKVDDNELDKPLYPLYNQRRDKSNLLIKIITFVCVLATLITLIINLLVHKDGEKYWFPTAAASMFYLFVLVRNCILSKHNTAFKILMQMITISLLVTVIDYFSSWSKWSINYVIPILSAIASTTIIIVLLARKVKYSEYVFCLISSIIIGFIPFILWLFKLVNVLWPSLLAALFSLTAFLGMIIFADKETKEEFKKRFHI